MRNIDFSSFTSGIFIKESKNRFLCEVFIENQITECYIPSSCRLENFLKLKGKAVLLEKIQTKNSRTSYSVVAVPYKHSYIILNTSFANLAVANSLQSRRLSFIGKRSSFLQEHRINGYKSDLFIKGAPSTIIEIKSLLSLNKEAVFPTLYSQRAIDQLKHLIELAKNGYKLVYLIISLNPYVTKLSFNSQHTEHNALIKAAIDNGMVIKCFSSKLVNNKLQLYKQIPISFD